MSETWEGIRTGARKDDSGKPLINQGVRSYFPRAIEAVAKVSEFGAKKYAWGGWKQVPNGFERYTEALERHMNDEAKGELWDRESKELHAAHIAWNALARLELLTGMETKQEGGDRD